MENDFKTKNFNNFYFVKPFSNVQIYSDKKDLNNTYKINSSINISKSNVTINNNINKRIKVISSSNLKQTKNPKLDINNCISFKLNQIVLPYKFNLIKIGNKCFNNLQFQKEYNIIGHINLEILKLFFKSDSYNDFFNFDQNNNTEVLAFCNSFNFDNINNNKCSSNIDKLISKFKKNYLIDNRVLLCEDKIKNSNNLYMFKVSTAVEFVNNKNTKKITLYMQILSQIFYSEEIKSIKKYILDLSLINDDKIIKNNINYKKHSVENSKFLRKNSLSLNSSLSNEYSNNIQSLQKENNFNNLSNYDILNIKEISNFKENNWNKYQNALNKIIISTDEFLEDQLKDLYKDNILLVYQNITNKFCEEINNIYQIVENTSQHIDNEIKSVNSKLIFKNNEIEYLSNKLKRSLDKVELIDTELKQSLLKSTNQIIHIKKLGEQLNNKEKEIEKLRKYNIKNMQHKGISCDLNFKDNIDTNKIINSKQSPCVQNNFDTNIKGNNNKLLFENNIRTEIKSRYIFNANINKDTSLDSINKVNSSNTNDASNIKNKNIIKINKDNMQINNISSNNNLFKYTIDSKNINNSDIYDNILQNKEVFNCVICLDNIRHILLCKCNHLVYCNDCFKKVQEKLPNPIKTRRKSYKCPICNQISYQFIDVKIS